MEEPVEEYYLICQYYLWSSLAYLGDFNIVRNQQKKLREVL